MVIFIDESSDIPVYKQIRNQIVVGISDGKLTPGEKLPTVRALAQEIGINTMTANKAYQVLKQEGYLYIDKRNGARVRESFSQVSEMSHEMEEQLKGIISEVKIRGMKKEVFLNKCNTLFGREET